MITSVYSIDVGMLAYFNNIGLGEDPFEMIFGLGLVEPSAEISEREGAISLKVFLDACKEDKVEPFKKYSGKFVVRAREIQHREFVAAAASEGKSLNQGAEVSTIEFLSINSMVDTVLQMNLIILLNFRFG